MHPELFVSGLQLNFIECSKRGMQDENHTVPGPTPAMIASALVAIVYLWDNEGKYCDFRVDVSDINTTIGVGITPKLRNAMGDWSSHPQMISSADNEIGVYPRNCWKGYRGT